MIENVLNTQWQGLPTTPDIGAKPPTPIHCATHKQQPTTNPLPKIYATKNASQRLPKWWQSSEKIGKATVTPRNQVTLSI